MLAITKCFLVTNVIFIVSMEKFVSRPFMYSKTVIFKKKRVDECFNRTQIISPCFPISSPENEAKLQRF